METLTLQEEKIEDYLHDFKVEKTSERIFF